MIGRKPHSASRIHSLTAAQLQQLDEWLFQENLSYRDIGRRWKTKFGFNLDQHAISRYYRDTKQKQNLDEIIARAHHANATVKKLAQNPVETSKAILQIAGQLAFDTAVQNASGEQPDLDTLRKVMDVYLDTRKDDREAGKLELDREKWEFDASRACLQHQAELQTITTDQSLDEDARILAIRQRLFGLNLPN
jgi:hypothetical protein